MPQYRVTQVPEGNAPPDMREPSVDLASARRRADGVARFNAVAAWASGYSE